MQESIIWERERKRERSCIILKFKNEINEFTAKIICIYSEKCLHNESGYRATAAQYPFFTTYYIVKIYPMNNIYDAVAVFELAWASSSLRRLLDTYNHSIAATSNKPISFVSLHMYTLICLSMNRKRIEIPENLFPILLSAHIRSMCITNIDLGLTQIHTDIK